MSITLIQPLIPKDNRISLANTVTEPKQYHPLELDAKLMAGMQCAATPSKCAQRSDDKCKNEWFWETDKDQALTSAKAFCKALNPKNEGKKSVVETVSRIVDGDRVVKDYTNGMGVWDIKVEDVEGCLTEEQHGERRYMSQPTVKYSCVDVLYDLWRQCDNKGRGGSVEIGCLKYTMIPAKPTAGDIKDWHNSGWHSWRFAL